MQECFPTMKNCLTIVDYQINPPTKFPSSVKKKKEKKAFNRDADIEKGLVDMGPEMGGSLGGDGGMNSESSIDIYTPPGTKRRAGRKPLNTQEPSVVL